MHVNVMTVDSGGSFERIYMHARTHARTHAHTHTHTHTHTFVCHTLAVIFMLLMLES